MLDDTTKNVLKKIMQSSWYTVIVEGDVRVHGFFLKDRMFFFPAHFVRFCENHPQRKVQIKSTFNKDSPEVWLNGEWISSNAHIEPINDLACVVI